MNDRKMTTENPGWEDWHYKSEERILGLKMTKGCGKFVDMWEDGRVSVITPGNLFGVEAGGNAKGYTDGIGGMRI